MAAGLPPAGVPTAAPAVPPAGAGAAAAQQAAAILPNTGALLNPTTGSIAGVGQIDPQILNAVSQQFVSSIQSLLGADGKPKANASGSFLQQSGSFQVRPAESSKPKQADDSGYWEALGYEA